MSYPNAPYPTLSPHSSLYRKLSFESDSALDDLPLELCGLPPPQNIANQGLYETPLTKRVKVTLPSPQCIPVIPVIPATHPSLQGIQEVAERPLGIGARHIRH